MRLVLDELDQNLRYTQRLPVSFPRPGVSFLISIEAVALLKSLLPWRILIVHPGKNSNSSGVGISLSVEDGGHPYLLKEIFRPRLELKLADFTNLVLLDGHALRTATSATARNGACLLVSQLIICLQTIAVSGTIIMKLS
jgi:hypothetical protein